MYLSRVEINPKLRLCKLALNSPQQLHAMIEGSFPSQTEKGQAKERHLWRIDKLYSSLYILVVSPSRPDFSHLIEQIGWPASGQRWETAEYDVFLDRIMQGQQWQFRLQANPTCSKKDAENSKARGKVIPCLSIEEQKNWLETKMDKYGAVLNGFELSSREVNQFSRNGITVTLNVATFDGILTVDNSDLLKGALVGGIGRGKAYGCGLLTLAQVLR